MSTSEFLQTATTVSGLAAAYGFNEGTGTTTADLSGNRATGQIKGATWTTGGKYGAALSFNGSNSYVDLGNPSSLQSTGSMSWSAWVYITGNPPDDGQIVARSTDQAGWQFKTSPDTGKRTFAVAVSTSSAHVQRYSKTVPSLKTWYHVAGVYNASAKTLDIYVNGALDDGVLSGTVPSSQVLPNVNTTIGMRSGGYYFQGTIDELRIYNRALAQSEIVANMNTAVSATAITTQMTGTVSSLATLQSDDLAQAAPSVIAPQHVSSLSCYPKTVSAGAHLSCELRTTASPTPLPLTLASSSDQLKVPAAVVTRANQTRISFRAVVDPSATQQSVTVTATLGSTTLQDTVVVLPAAGPLLSVPARQLAQFGMPLSFTVSAFDPAGLPLQITADGLPAEAAFDTASGQFDWTPTPSQAGRYQITFVATNSAHQSATARVRIEVGSGLPVLSSAPLACSPGSVTSLTGRWLAAPGSSLADPSGSSLELAGTRVTVNGQAVPVLFSSPARVSFLCPAWDTGTPLAVVVETAAGSSDLLTATMLAATPTLYSLDGSGQNQGLISFAETTDLAMPRNYEVPAHPAQAGDRILIWATGLGAADVASGAVVLKLGDANAELELVQPVAGYAGVYTIQARVPAASPQGDSVPVQLEVSTPDGLRLTSNTVTLAIEALAE